MPAISPFFPNFRQLHRSAFFATARLVLAFALASTWALPSKAQLMEPDGTPVPILTGEMGAAPGSLTLNQLFTSRGETLDYLTNASTVPATFEPRCSFTGTLVMRGGGCEIEFGWYNANMTLMTPPPNAEIYVLVPTTDPSFANGAFSPQAGPNGPIDNNGNPVQLTVFTADSIRTNPNYLGGEIGFALKGSPGQCSQTHFSEQRLNPLCTAAGCAADDHWIAAVIYQSTVTANAYYIAFEDLPIDPMDFNNNNDGDFNDFVYFVEGITCDGGGVPCDTGLLGVCGPGLTECQPDGSLECRSQIDPSDEVCDAIDNDCDGMVDNGDLCAETELCVRGQCEPFCGGEFPCPDGYVCLDRVCVEDACAPGAPPVAIVCPEGEVCSAGECAGPCEGVTCPIGKVCEIGVCVDPCAGITCDVDEICQAGVCVLNCNCRPCAEGVCNTVTGECVEAACETVACTAPEVCQAGVCVDSCTGAVCPGGATCTAGACDPPAPPIEGVVDLSQNPVAAGGGSGLDLDDDPAVTNGGSGGSAGAAAVDEPEDPLETFGQNPPQPTKGCGCHVPGRSGTSTLWPLLTALGFLLIRRSRKHTRPN